MNIIIKLAEIVAKISLSISNVFSLIHIKIIDKFEININKPKHEKEILENTSETRLNVKRILGNQDEIDRLKEREKIIREIINKNLINVNDLNKLSKSEYFIVIPKLYIKLNKETKTPFWISGDWVCDLHEKADREDYLEKQKQYRKVYGMDEVDIG